MRINRKRELLFYDIYGTVAGTLLALLIHLPVSALESLPYVQPKMIFQVQHWYNTHGVLGLFYQPFSGVPYKVFTHTAADYHFFIPLFLILAVTVRLTRYLIFYGMFVAIYPVLHRFVYQNYLKLLLVATFIFSLLLLRVYDIYGPSYQVSYSSVLSLVER